MRNEWLRQKVTVQEAEAMNLVINEKWPQGLPFGYLSSGWQELLHKKQDGDEIWTYGSSEESWANLMGQEGIALVRNGEIIDALITCEN